MSIPVSLQDVVDELETISDESTAYLNRQTGELYTFTDDELRWAEGNHDSDEDAEAEEMNEWI